MAKQLNALTVSIPIISRKGPANPTIEGLAYDSRLIKKNYLFFAFQGLHADGHDYINAAIQNGASAIIYDKELSTFNPAISYIKVLDARLAMSQVSDDYFDHPSDSLYVIGVTGTEGKSTTVYLIYQLLKLAGYKAGFFSTVMSDSGNGEVPNPEHQTTPEAIAVHQHLASMRDAGCFFAVVESSSHGLSSRTGRLANVHFDCAIMMNVTHEHLEFHGTWEQYRSDKANLFRNLDTHRHKKIISGVERTLPSFGLVNADDPSANYFAACTQKPVYSFSLNTNCATVGASNLVPDERGCSFILNDQENNHYPVRINLPGTFNVMNAMAALVAVSKITGLTYKDLIPLLPQLKPVRGRMMRLSRGQPFEVVIDYAHTPSSFETVLAPLRRQYTGRIICLFGSAGERDTAKRPLQGAIAEKYCDILVLTDEDPRGEDSMRILEEIAEGCKHKIGNTNLFLIPDRPTAIRYAFSLAKPGDLVLLLGKGHENSIIYQDRVMPYDEEKEALQALRELGFH